MVRECAGDTQLLTSQLLVQTIQAVKKAELDFRNSPRDDALEVLAACICTRALALTLMLCQHMDEAAAERERAEKERLERVAAERAEKERADKERAERADKERLERERVDKERTERLERADKAERERIGKEREREKKEDKRRQEEEKKRVAAEDKKRRDDDDKERKRLAAVAAAAAGSSPALPPAKARYPFACTALSPLCLPFSLPLSPSRSLHLALTVCSQAAHVRGHAEEDEHARDDRGAAARHQADPAAQEDARQLPARPGQVRVLPFASAAGRLTSLMCACVLGCGGRTWRPTSKWRSVTARS